MAQSRITYRGVVYPTQCDHMGHMNVASYVAKFDEATWQLFAAIGLMPSGFRAGAIGMAGVQQDIVYERELYPGDVVTVESSVLEVKERVLRFAHVLRNDETGEVAARMTVVAVHLDRATRRASALPRDVRERALALIDGGEPADRAEP